MTNLPPPHSLLRLHTDILIHLLNKFLVLQDLTRLSRTSRFLHALVNEFAWGAYERQNPRPSMSLSKSREKWTAMARVKYDILTDEAWTQSEFIARPLSGAWPGKEQPRLAINPSRLVVAAGVTLHSYLFGTSANDHAPPIVHEGSCSLARTNHHRNFITALAFIPDGGRDQTLCVGYHDGTSDYVVILGRSKRQAPPILRIHRSPSYPLDLPRKDRLQNLVSSRNALLSLSAGGRVMLASTEMPSLSSSMVDLQVRSWVSHLSMESPTPYAAFGTSSTTPLTIHLVTNDRLAPLPSAVLSQAESAAGSSAVYGICSGPPSSPWGPSPQVVVSGWYNGTVLIHDLRSCLRNSAPRTLESLAPLRPVLSLVNSWSVEPIYSVSCGGGAGSHVAAGSARHSLLSLWDVRYPTGGFSLHAPLNDPSPVYAITLESSRLFGVTQSRPFVLDFGRGITETTYPKLELGPRGLTHPNQKGQDGFGYYVTKYQHQSPRV
ncbi:hypothetical protein B0H15DRAFT_826976 [Mycena belliarum]|uniref:F-box domain-containing protein n=1 Tax=Mycena belliarum TaxID=1033014 RepID=A0AAD6XU38_9AGAR|nr:hypothetical protein B0H15DRAFT_826976 [Mycena belliae]